MRTLHALHLSLRYAFQSLLRCEAILHEGLRTHVVRCLHWCMRSILSRNGEIMAAWHAVGSIRSDSSLEVTWLLTCTIRQGVLLWVLYVPSTLSSL